MQPLLDTFFAGSGKKTLEETASRELIKG